MNEIKIKSYALLLQMQTTMQALFTRILFKLDLLFSIFTKYY